MRNIYQKEERDCLKGIRIPLFSKANPLFFRISAMVTTVAIAVDIKQIVNP